MPAARHLLASRPAATGGPPVGGYMAWYDATRIVGQADATALATWTDLSANHYDQVVAGGQAGPTYYSTTVAKLINGKPAVWFDGATTGMWNAGLPVAAAQTVAVVAQSLSPASDNALWASGQTGGLTLRVNANKLDLVATGLALIMTSTAAVPAVPSFVASTFAPGVGPAGVYVNSATPDTLASTQAMGDANYTLGYQQVYGEHLNGPICELLTYPTVLTGPQIAATYTYLKTKWGTP